MSARRFRIFSNRSSSSGHPLYPEAPWFVFDYFFMDTGGSRTFNLTHYPGRLEGICYPNEFDWAASVEIYGFGWLRESGFQHLSKDSAKKISRSVPTARGKLSHFA